MDTLQTEDGQFFIKSLAQFIRQHEKALANSLQLAVHKRQTPTNGYGTNSATVSSTSSTSSNHQIHSTLASALSLAGLKFVSQNVRSAHLTLTPHHLYYLLSRIEDLDIPVGPMNVRIESIHGEPSQSNYVSFLQGRHIPKKARGDNESIHSVSSVRSVMSGISAFWSTIGLGSGTAKSERAKAAVEADLKYLYSACTKLPSLRLTSDPRARLIKGYEEFPFDTAVPLFAFKNLQQLEVVDMDFRQFHGWDRLADQLCLLTVKRGRVEDVEDLLTNIVLDDAEKRRKRLNKLTFDEPLTPSWTMPSTPATPRATYHRQYSDSGSPEEGTPGASPPSRDQIVIQSDTIKTSIGKTGTGSPKRPTPQRPVSSYRHSRSYSAKIKRSGSGSSNSSDFSTTPTRTHSSTNLFGDFLLPASKWQKLKYLSLADNALTKISSRGVAPLANTLRSLSLASNLFSDIPESLSTLTRLASLDMSNCMISSLQSLSQSPLPAITTMKLKSNRLQSLAGIERIISLEQLDLRDNLIADPMELARLSGMPNLRKIWVKHNPFVKNFPDYRVTIMNIFRQTPGYVEDIIIDDDPVTYVEKKSLAPRVPEPDRSSMVVSAPLKTQPPVIVHIERNVPNSSANDSKSSQDTSTGSIQRKKGPRRRIVDLAAKDDGLKDENVTLSIDTNVQDLEGHEVGQDPSLESHHDSLETGPSEALPNMDADEQHHDEYRVRIEALRQQFGNNWLHALNEHHIHSDHHFATEYEQQRPTMHHSPGPIIITSGRSLG